MNKALLCILISAKEVNKWGATKHLIEFPLHHELLLVNRQQGEDILIKLTVKGYNQYKNLSEE